MCIRDSLSVDPAAYPAMRLWEASDSAPAGLTRSQYLSWVYAQGTTANGVFSTKLSWIQLEWMWPAFREIPAYAELSDDEIFQTVFPSAQVIHLTRRDRVAQAVSWVRAEQEWVWVVSDDEPAAPVAEPTYDPELTTNLVRLIGQSEDGWRSFFSRLGLQPIEVVYEDLIEDFGAGVANLVDRLGLGPIDPSSITPRTMRQANELNAAWIEQYELDH